MRKFVDFLCWCLVFLLALGLVAALTPSAWAQTITIGSGIACDTAEEVQRYFTLLEDDPVVAIEQVNAEVQKPTACGMMLFAVHTGRVVAEGRFVKGTYKVIEILIVSIFDGREWQPIMPLKQYTAIGGAPEKGV